MVTFMISLSALTRPCITLWEGNASVVFKIVEKWRRWKNYNCFPPTNLFWFGLVWFGCCCFFFFNFRYGGMIVTKETKIIVSSPSRTQDLCFGKRRLNFCASRWLVEVSLEVVKPRLTARLCDCCFHCGTTCYWPFYAKVKVDWC